MTQDTSPQPANDEPDDREPVPEQLLDPEILKKGAIAAIRTCYDPEIPVNVYDLGLIYDVEIKPNQHVDVLMTLTSPGCPVAGTLPKEVEDRVAEVPGVKSAHVEITWEPPWTPDKMTEEARMDLGFL